MNDKGSSPQDAFVVRCPRQLILIGILLGCAGAAYLAHGLLHAGRFLLAEDVWVILSAIAIASSLAALSTWNARFEIDAENISQYRGSRLVRRAPVMAVQEIRIGLSRKIYRFAGGQKFTVNDQWENAAVAHALFRAILDARASAPIDGAEQPPTIDKTAIRLPQPETVGGNPLSDVAHNANTFTLPVQYLCFPAACVRCGRPPTTSREITASRGIDVILFAFRKGVTTAVPVCGPCKGWRATAGVVGTLMSIATVLGWVVGGFILAGPAIESGAMWTIIGGFFALVWLTRNRLDRLLDRIFLRVRALRVNKDLQMVTLWFRDPVLAGTVAELTERRRQDVLAAARGLGDDKSSGD